LRFSPVVVYSYLQVFSPARVATWCAFEVPWGHYVKLPERTRLTWRINQLSMEAGGV